MIIDEEHRAIQMEQRDINYILPAYVISYLFQCRNEDPERITFPMYPSVPHPRKPNVFIPIEYVQPDSPVAVDIKADGADVPEATEEQIRQLDEKEDEIRKLKEELTKTQAELEGTADMYVKDLRRTDETDKAVSPARAAFAEHIAEELATGILDFSSEYPEQPAEPKVVAEETPTTTVADRVPKQPPGGALPPGTPLDGMQSRTPGFEKQIAKDIAPQADVNEEEEVATEIEKPKE